MAQGQLKKISSKPTSTSKSTNAGITKKGSRTITPKKAKLIKQAKLSKKFTSGLTAQTERMLGEKAGHLEMLGKSKSKKDASGAGGQGGKQKKGAKRG